MTATDVQPDLKSIVVERVMPHPPQKVYWGYGAEVIDPNGYRIRLWDEASMAEKGATRAPRKSKK